jgi:hypothetical protein
MKKASTIILFFLLLLLIIIGGILYFQKKQKGFIEKSPAREEQLSKINIMKISSPAFKNNQFIPAKYTCDGENINPPLKIDGVPEGTKSLALIVDDPDAPMGVWSHWVLFNIDPSVQFIEENSVPKGAVQGINDFRKHEYGGPCPPYGAPHHYHFKIYALDSRLDLPPTSSREDLLRAMQGHIIDWAKLVGIYQKVIPQKWRWK